MRTRSPNASPWNRIALLACLAAALANALLLASASLRQRAARSLQAQVSALEDNLETLTQLQADRRSQLEAQLGDAQERRQAAEDALPRIEKSFDVFQLGYALAASPGVLVTSIRRSGSEVRDTSIGPVEVTTDRVTALANLDSCLAYIDSLESLGAGLGLAGVSIQPGSGDCSMDVLTLGRTP